MRQEFPAARLCAAITVLFMLAMIAGTIAFTRIWNATLGIYEVAAVVCVLSVWVAWRNFRLLVHRGPIVIIDREGVFDARVMARPVPWSAITEITYEGKRRGGILLIHATYPDRYERPGPRLLSNIRRGGSLSKEFGIAARGLKARLFDLLVAAASTENPRALNTLARYVYHSDKPVPRALELPQLLRRIRRAARTPEDRLALACALLDGSLPPDPMAARRLIDSEIARDPERVREFGYSLEFSSLVPYTPFLDMIYKRLLAAGQDTGDLAKTTAEELQRAEDWVLHGPPAASPGKRRWAGAKTVFWIVVGVFLLGLATGELLDHWSDATNAAWRMVSGRVTEARVVAHGGDQVMSFAFEEEPVRFVVAADHPQYGKVTGVPWTGVFATVVVLKLDYAEATRKVRTFAASDGRQPRDDPSFWLSKDTEVPICAMTRDTTRLIDRDASCQVRAEWDGWPRRISNALPLLVMFMAVPFLVRREARVMLGRRSRF